MSMETPLLRLDQACVGFGQGLRVLDGLDLELRRGEFLGLLGPSGCGKSTVLRVMAGLQPLQGGRVTSNTASLAFVFQEPALMPWASVQTNVGLPLKLSGMDEARSAQRVAGVLERVGLAGRGGALPHELSGGMKMRSSIARALVMQPELLLMDEPFAALDDPTRQRLQADLAQWWLAERFGVCFVTHQVAEAVYMCTRVVVLSPRGGQVLATFDIDEPFPRDEAFRRSLRFHERCVAVSEAMATAEAGP